MWDQDSSARTNVFQKENNKKNHRFGQLRASAAPPVEGFPVGPPFHTEEEGEFTDKGCVVVVQLPQILTFHAFFKTTMS